MCLKNKEKLVEKLKKSKIYLTYFNTWCMVYYTIQLQTGEEATL